MAASNAATVFSTMPLAASCSPRWAIGRRKAARSSMACLSSRASDDGVDLDGGSRAAGSETPTATRVWRPLSPSTSTIRSDAPLTTLRVVGEFGRGVDEAGQPDDPRDAVEAAERGLGLGEDVERARRAASRPSATDILRQAGR